MDISPGGPPEESDVAKEIRDFVFRALAWLLGERWARRAFIAVFAIAVAWAWGNSIVALIESTGQHIQAAYYRIRPIPTANTGSFTVAVAQLDDDDDGRVERLVVEDLREIGWIRVLQIHRRIDLGGADWQKSVLQGQSS